MRISSSSESDSTSSVRAIENWGKSLPSTTNKTTIHAVVARAIWPRKTAEHWAAAAGVKPRMAKYWLNGKFRVSAEARLALKDQL